jgi:hypothetical protein
MILLDNNNGLFGATVAGTDPRSTGGHPKLQQKKRRLQMNKFRFTINVLAIAIFTFAFASIAQAQATRTWVSGVGDDANPCSRTAPCKTFAGAISKTADPGEIDALDPGGFGAVTITKSITLDGTGTFASILSSGVQGIIINAPGKNVRIRGLSIQGAGTTLGTNGIAVLAAADVHVDDCVIMGYSQNGIFVNTTATSQLILRNVVIRDCAVAGINTTTTSTNQTAFGFDNINVSNCGDGFKAQNGSSGSIRGSTFTLNTNGINASQSTSNTFVNIDSSLITGSSIAVNTGASAHVRISRMLISQNANALGLGGVVDSGGNNTIHGNTNNQAPNGTTTAQN